MFFSSEHAIYIKRREWHSGTQSTPYFKWHRQPCNYNYKRIIGSLGYRYLQKSGKLVQQGSHSAFLGHGGSQTTIYSYIENKKWYRSPYFRFDPTYSSTPSHSIPLSFRNLMDKVKIEDVSELHLNTHNKPHNSMAGVTIKLPLQYKSFPLNISLRDDKSFNMPILNKLPPRHAWRKHFPSDCMSNVWILAIDHEEPITAAGAIDYLNF